MLFTRTLILFALALLANAGTTTTDAASPTFTPDTTLPTLTPTALPTRIIVSVQEYFSSVEAQSNWTSAVQALTSAMPASISSQIVNDPADYLGSVFGGGPLPSWLSAVPTNYTNYFSSIAAAKASIASKAAEGPAPTNGPRVKIVGAALAVGAAGLALL